MKLFPVLNAQNIGITIQAKSKLKSNSGINITVSLKNIKIIHAHQRKNGTGAKSYSVKQLLLKFVVILSSLFSI